MTHAPRDWSTVLAKAIQKAAESDPQEGGFAEANIHAVEYVVAGRGPDADSSDPETGARMVVNIAAVHVPAFCEASRRDEPKPYKNGYDLNKYGIGTRDPDYKPKNREIVDDALPLDVGVTPDNLYFGAVELNGCGIRFYGDVCLVLKPSAIQSNTVVLDRNSYDLIRAPIRDVVDAEPLDRQADVRQSEAWKLRGLWEVDKGAMAAIKVMGTLGLRQRRFTTGQISEAVRSDEDYMEVLKINSFKTKALQEARFSAADAAHDALTGDRLSQRPSPRLEALMSRFRRRVAENALRDEGVSVRVVTTPGRTKD